MHNLLIAIAQLDTLATNTQQSLSKTLFITGPVMAVAGFLISMFPPLKKVGYGIIVCAMIAVVGCTLVSIGVFDELIKLAG